MSDLEEQLNSILGDPEQMSRIADLAKSLMGGEDGDAQALPAGVPGGLASLMQSVAGGGKDDAQALLEAMKPWLSEKRRHKVDRAVKIARMAKLAEMAMGEGAGEQTDV